MKKIQYGGIARTTYSTYNKSTGTVLTPKIINDMVKYQKSAKAYKRYIEDVKAAYGMVNYFLKRLLK